MRLCLWAGLVEWMNAVFELQGRSHTMLAVSFWHWNLSEDANLHIVVRITWEMKLVMPVLPRLVAGRDGRIALQCGYVFLQPFLSRSLLVPVMANVTVISAFVLCSCGSLSWARVKNTLHLPVLLLEWFESQMISGFPHQLITKVLADLWQTQPNLLWPQKISH